MKEIEKIIASYHNIDWEKEKVALGTVVKVEGSAYRRIGARMFVCNNGNWVGGISGGCLEGDALKRAQIAILKNESSIVVYDTTEDDPHQIGVGLGCNGRIEVLFTPIDPTDEQNQLEFLQQIIHKRDSTALLQVLNINAGKQALRGAFYDQSRFTELAENIAVPLDLIQKEVNRAYRRRKSNVFRIQNEAGHEYEILVELIRPKIKLICVGDNYDVNAFMDIAKALGWETHIVGKLRKIGKRLHQMAHQIHPLEGLKNLSTDAYTAVVLMSHDYKTDLHILEQILTADIPYIGLLGPRKRMQKMQEDLVEKYPSLDLSQKENLYAPVGLDIGAESPEEIALSIASEIIAVFRQREGRFLKDRKGSIHERL